MYPSFSNLSMMFCAMPCPTPRRLASPGVTSLVRSLQACKVRRHRHTDCKEWSIVGGCADCTTRDSEGRGLCAGREGR